MALFKQRRKLPRPVEHASDFNAVFHRAIKDNVVANSEASQSRSQFLTHPPHFRHPGQHCKPGDDGVDKPIRRIHVVLGDVEPNFIQAERATSETRYSFTPLISCGNSSSALCPTVQ